MPALGNEADSLDRFQISNAKWEFDKLCFGVYWRISLFIKRLCERASKKKYKVKEKSFTIIAQQVDT